MVHTTLYRDHVPGFEAVTDSSVNNEYKIMAESACNHITAKMMLKRWNFCVPLIVFISFFGDAGFSQTIRAYDYELNISEEQDEGYIRFNLTWERSWLSLAMDLRISDRNVAVKSITSRGSDRGFRGVRTAP